MRSTYSAKILGQRKTLRFNAIQRSEKIHIHFMSNMRCYLIDDQVADLLKLSISIL